MSKLSDGHGEKYQTHVDSLDYLIPAMSGATAVTLRARDMSDPNLGNTSHVNAKL